MFIYFKIIFVLSTIFVEFSFVESQSMNGFISGRIPTDIFYNNFQETDLGTENSYSRLVDTWPDKDSVEMLTSSFEEPLDIQLNLEGRRSARDRDGLNDFYSPRLTSRNNKGKRKRSRSNKEMEMLKSLGLKLDENRDALRKIVSSIKSSNSTMNPVPYDGSNYVIDGRQIGVVVQAVLQKLEQIQKEKHKRVDPPLKKFGKDNKGSSMERVLEKIFKNIEELKEQQKAISEDFEKAEEKKQGKPCEITGTWKSHILGVRLNISVHHETLGHMNLNDDNRHKIHATLLKITILKSIFQKKSQIINASWKFSGTAVNLIGGPFYLNTHSSDATILGSFLGYCRTCAETDTIFGTWSFILPSKGCADITTSMQNRRDIFRREKRTWKPDTDTILRRSIDIPESCNDLKYLDFVF